MTARETKLRSQLIALLREIHLRPIPRDECWIESNFIYPVSPVGFAGLGMTLWYTHKARRLCRDIAALLGGTDVRLLSAGLETTTHRIRDYIQSICLDGQYFTTSPAFLGGADTLHNSLLKPIVQTAQSILLGMVDCLRRQVCTWLVVYPLRRTATPLQKITSEQMVGLLPAHDDEAWRSAISDFKNFLGWDRLQFAYPKQTASGPCTLLACIAEGSCDSARSHAVHVMRQFVGVLLAHLFAENAGSIMRSAADPPTYSAQCPRDDARPGIGLNLSPVGAIFPALIQDLEVNETTLNTVNAWFARSGTLDASIRDRSRRAAEFCQYALVADELERFLFFFFALDSLFGNRDSVERSILAGLEHTLAPTRNDLSVQFARLYDLRSEVVHGGSTTIEDWGGFLDYVRHFDTDPRTDLQRLALEALRHYVAAASTLSSSRKP